MLTRHFTRSDRLTAHSRHRSIHADLSNVCCPEALQLCHFHLLVLQFLLEEFESGRRFNFSPLLNFLVSRPI
jgi:hypothetical protein